MTEKMPNIGITCRFEERAKNYIRGVTEAGGHAKPLEMTFSTHPYTSQEWIAELRRFYLSLDGLLMSGGGDMDSCLYGEEPLLNEEGKSVLYDVFPERDVMEMQLCRWALEDDMPILAICRGHQLLNVVRGGTLFQDIYIQKSPTHSRAKDYNDPWTVRAHSVTLAPQSRLAHILDTTEIETNSLHHQAVKDLGDGLVQVGLTDDFINEANEMPAQSWCVSMQFHPEGMLDVEPRFGKLFRSFVEAARSYSHEHTQPELAVAGM